jgi:cycloeucalenol cycloisomerase
MTNASERTGFAGAPASDISVARRFSLKAGWFSENPDKAWGEKFFLTFVPVFLIYNAIVIKMQWLNVGNFWHVTQNLAMWIPYCILLPAYLRRNSGVPWYKSYWFKFNVYMAVWIFFATYFHTEYFFQLLGFHYKFPHVTLNYDSYLVGPNEATALADAKKVPIGMYFNAIAFFIVYHTIAVVAMRRVKNTLVGLSPTIQSIGWVIIVAAAAWFFGWAEPRFYNTNPEAAAVTWYDDINAMLKVGAYFYALYFIVSFPNVFRLDERADDTWTIRRTIVEACFVSMVTLFLLDLWGWFYGPIA